MKKMPCSKITMQEFLDIALVNHLVHGEDIYQTLLENVKNPHLFQYILKAGNTYKGSFDQYGKSI